MESPECIKNQTLFTSLFSDKKTVTFANSGLLINPGAGIKSISKQDTLSGERDDSALSPRELLAETRGNLWNEVIVSGRELRFWRKKPRAVGYFVLLARDGTPTISTDKLEWIEGLSQLNSLPLVFISTNLSPMSFDGQNGKFRK